MILNELKANGIVAVVRGKSHEEARGYMEACLRGGIKSQSVPDNTIFWSFRYLPIY